MTTLTTATVFKLTALEDLNYRLASSYPKDGFPLGKGQTMHITSEGLKLLSTRRRDGKGKGTFKVEEVHAQ